MRSADALIFLTSRVEHCVEATTRSAPVGPMVCTLPGDCCGGERAGLCSFHESWTMKLLKTSVLAALACFSLNLRSAEADNAYAAAGVVQFKNLQATLSTPGESAPYFGVGVSRQIGLNVQTGSILPTSAPMPVGYDPITNVVTLEFTGMQGPHPNPSLGAVHVIQTLKGDIHCTWEAVFTMELDLDTGDAILSGDGAFTIIGGTRHYRKATGSFQTLFETDVVPAGADSALADWTQNGEICR